MPTIGSFVAVVIVGGAILYSGQNEATASSNDATFSVVTSAGVALEDTVVSVPLATTRNASKMTASTATLHGRIDPNGVEISYWFEYSSDPRLGQVLNRRTSRVSLNVDSNQTSVEADVAGLTSSTTYYFRIVVEDSIGDIVRGDRVSFKTI